MSILPFSEFKIQADEEGRKWIVNLRTGTPYMDETALAWLCEVGQPEISNMANQSAKCPKPLLGIDLTNMVEIKNPNGGKPFVGIPEEVCILSYGGSGAIRPTPYRLWLVLGYMDPRAIFMPSMGMKIAFTGQHTSSKCAIINL